MSEFSLAVLVKFTDLAFMRQILEKRGHTGYLQKVNQEWISISFKNDLDISDELARKVAVWLETDVIYYEFSEDGAWSFSYYERGFMTVSYSRAYADPEKKCIDFERLEKHVSHNNYFCQLIECIENENNWLKEAELFKKAFNFEKVEWFNYEIISGLSSTDRRKQGFVEFGQSKVFNPIRFITQYYNNSLKEYGFKKVYDDIHDVAFLKLINGFYAGLCLNISGGDLYGILRTHLNTIDIFYKTHRRCIYFPFTGINPEEPLKKILDQFLSFGLKQIEDETLIQFDIFEVYENIVDRTMENLHLTRTYTDTDLIKGKAIYEGNGKKVVFDHGKKYPNISCILVNNNSETIIKINQWERYSFLNREKYAQLVGKLLEKLNQELETIDKLN